ncbi:MAG: hypothetical protein LBR68_05590, partial [Lachnoclostridium sp.]|nr:hypothetical protein [Lachnoclostridium sp.]
MKSLYEYLIRYRERDIYPYHMPGHKRNPAFFMDNPYTFDVTETEETDDLYQASDILKEGQERAKEAYGSYSTNYLVGGSTVGILAAVSACTNLEDKILIARNCHK